MLPDGITADYIDMPTGKSLLIKGVPRESHVFQVTDDEGTSQVHIIWDLKED